MNIDASFYHKKQISKITLNAINSGRDSSV